MYVHPVQRIRENHSNLIEHTLEHIRPVDQLTEKVLRRIETAREMRRMYEGDIIRGEERILVVRSSREAVNLYLSERPFKNKGWDMDDPTNLVREKWVSGNLSLIDDRRSITRKLSRSNNQWWDRWVDGDDIFRYLSNDSVGVVSRIQSEQPWSFSRVEWGFQLIGNSVKFLEDVRPHISDDKWRELAIKHLQ